MPNVKTMLAQLNVIREKNGLPQLKAWKSSQENLELALSKYADPNGKPAVKVAAAVAEGAYATDEAAKRSTGHSARGKAPKTRLRKDIEKAVKASTPKPEKNTLQGVANNIKKMAQRSTPAKVVKVKGTMPAKIAPANGLVTLADIARSIKVDPKAARSKARRSDELNALAKDKDRWLFAPKDKAKVVALLKPKN